MNRTSGIVQQEVNALEFHLKSSKNPLDFGQLNRIGTVTSFVNNSMMLTLHDSLRQLCSFVCFSRIGIHLHEKFEIVILKHVIEISVMLFSPQLHVISQIMIENPSYSMEIDLGIHLIPAEKQSFKYVFSTALDSDLKSTAVRVLQYG